MDRSAACIIVLDPDPRESRQIAETLGRAGLGMISTARTADEAIFTLGRRRASLLIIDECVAPADENRLLRHIAKGSRHPQPALVRLLCASTANPPAVGRAIAAAVLQKPLDSHDLVVRVGSALHRTDLLGRFDRGLDQPTEHLAAARRMQLGLLPTTDQLDALQDECQMGIGAFCRSGEAVGGDFWGAWATGRGRFALAVADFAGHGLSAALNTFRLHAILSEPTLPRGAPARMTHLLNQRMHALLPRGHYASMVYAQLHPASHRIAWCSAGGPPPLFISRENCLRLPGRGLPLGVQAASAYEGHVTRLPGPGILCLFSDGLFEGGPISPEIPLAAIAAALAEPAAMAAAGRLAEATQLATAELEALRDRHACVDHSDDVMAICVALGTEET